ncbi:MAG: transcriptional regulator [Gammaproteobacteria bacterium CG22_combo_CG10-13_8_21_14_all_40_8]|nr:MAG: transcriptional regulator [Gammaproteobacteria bacterium CG22_combo_CG10-13_8_21_14_all_40_8]
MHFKMIIAFVDEKNTDDVMESARKGGATGVTVISNARGEGLIKSKTFLGLTLETQRNVLIMLVEEHLCRHILEEIGKVGQFDDKPGAGIAFQIDVEDAIGVKNQIQKISIELEDKL